MTKVTSKKNNPIIKTMKKLYGIDLDYGSDAEIHRELVEKGLPSLSKLLKMAVKRS